MDMSGILLDRDGLARALADGFLAPAARGFVGVLLEHDQLPKVGEFEHLRGHAHAESIGFASVQVDDHAHEFPSTPRSVGRPGNAGRSPSADEDIMLASSEKNVSTRR